jgi:hypothetical protein
MEYILYSTKTQLLKNSIDNNTCYFSSKRIAVSQKKHALFCGLVNFAWFVQNAAASQDAKSYAVLIHFLIE